MSKKICIAIDGPAAAGKSTIAKRLAEKLHYIYVDTGAMYRAAAYAALQENVDIQDEKAVCEVLLHSDVILKHIDGVQRIFLNGVDISNEIRSPEVTGYVSIVASYLSVRQNLVVKQQQLAKNGGVVMDGRDIATAVLPFAEVKVFMIASVMERAKRRHLENIEKGFPSNLEEIAKEIEKRDKLDSTRVHSPLVQSPDSVLIDTTGKTQDEVLDKIYQLVISKKHDN